MKQIALAGALTVALGWPALAQTGQEFLTWTAKQADAAGRDMYKAGRVGSSFAFRGLKTERSINYKLAATWLTPDVIRATVRLQQLTNRQTDEQAKAAVAAALSDRETVVMVEIDPREGSGVIPDDWLAFLEPKRGKDAAGPAVSGRQRLDLRTNPALAGVMRRNYDYDRFWVSFPLVVDGKPAIPPDADSIELVVRIYDKEGRVAWPISAALAASLARAR